MKRVSPHLGRGPEEPVNSAVQQFYERLLDVLKRPAVRNGKWRLLECVPAFDGNGSFDAFIACMWEEQDGERLLVAVNHAAHQSQGYVRLACADLNRGPWQLEDLLGDARYERDGPDLQTRGLYLDVPPWHCHVFRMHAA